MKTHDVFVLRIGQCCTLQTLVYFCQIFRLCQQFTEVFYRIRESMMKTLCITKHNLCYAFCHIMFHVCQYCRMFVQSIQTCRIQHHLGSVFPLPQKLVDTPAYLFPRKKCLIQNPVRYRMPHCNLHSQLIKPDGILCTVNDKSLSASSIFPAYKFCIFLRCLLNHKIIDDTKLASFPVAAHTQHFIHHIRGYGNLPGI